MGRQLVRVWALTLYVGQVIKDLYKLPRPVLLDKRVQMLSSRYEAEYGLPSTHAMGATSIPLVLYNNYILSGGSALLYWASVSASRLYLGVHSPADVVVGWILGATCFWSLHYFGDGLDHYLLFSCSYYVMILITLLAVLLYPRPVRVPRPFEHLQ